MNLLEMERALVADQKPAPLHTTLQGPPLLTPNAHHTTRQLVPLLIAHITRRLRRNHRLLEPTPTELSKAAPSARSAKAERK